VLAFVNAGDVVKKAMAAGLNSAAAPDEAAPAKTSTKKKSKK
jgi:hypothetical protein